MRSLVGSRYLLVLKKPELKFMHQIVNQVENMCLQIQWKKKRDAKIFLHLTLMIKRSTTETFCIDFEVNFLTMQLIFKGKTTLSLSKAKSLKRFRWVSMRAITVTKKSLKLLVEIVLHYITQTWDGLGLPVTQKAFLIYDVFRRRTITFHRFPWQQEHLRHQSFT